MEKLEEVVRRLEWVESRLVKVENELRVVMDKLFTIEMASIRNKFKVQNESQLGG